MGWEPVNLLCVSTNSTHWEPVNDRIITVRLKELTTAVEQEASKVGLGMNSDKCRVIVSGDWEGRSDIHTSGATIETVEHFCCLGSYISSAGN